MKTVCGLNESLCLDVVERERKGKTNNTIWRSGRIGFLNPISLSASLITFCELIKIKFELDTTPPPFASFEQKYRLLPIPYEIRLYDMPSLFAGKLHAVICRAWKSRIKGRDLYDYIFYLSRQTPVNLKHLNARLVDSGFEGAREDMTLPEIKQILLQRFSSIDYSQAKEDVLPFIRNPASLDVWSASFFQSITENLAAQ